MREKHPRPFSAHWVPQWSYLLAPAALIASAHTKIIKNSQHDLLGYECLKIYADAFKCGVWDVPGCFHAVAGCDWHCMSLWSEHPAEYCAVQVKGRRAMSVHELWNDMNLDRNTSMFSCLVYRHLLAVVGEDILDILMAHSMMLSLWWHCLSSSPGSHISPVSLRARFNICTIKPILTNIYILQYTCSIAAIEY